MKDQMLVFENRRFVSLTLSLLTCSSILISSAGAQEGAEKSSNSQIISSADQRASSEKDTSLDKGTSSDKGPGSAKGTSSDKGTNSDKGTSSDNGTSSDKTASSNKNSSSERKSNSQNEHLRNVANFQQSLDKTTLHLINVGDWNSVSERLIKQCSNDAAKSDLARLRRSYREGWLAFALMFNSKVQEVQTLSTQVERTRPALADVHDDFSALLYGNAMVIKAMSLVAQGKLALAQTVLSTVPENGRDNALYYFAQAAIAGKSGNAAQAIEYSNRAGAADNRLAWAYRTTGYLRLRWLKDSAGAEQALEEALKIEPQSSEVRDMLIDIRLSKNDFDHAIDLAEDGIKRNPHSAVEHFKLSQIYTQQWRLREALGQLDAAVKIDSSSAKYFRARASVKRLSGDLSGAISDQQVAVSLAKDKAFELVELAAMNVAAGNANKAVENYRQALAQDPANQQARERLFKLLLDEKRYSDLAEEYKKELALNANSYDLHLGYANVLLLSNESDRAVEEFKTAANLSQSNPAPHRALGAFYIAKKDFAKAAKEYTRALNISPTSVKDLVALGFCYAENDDYMQAEAAFVTALALQQLNPNSAPDDPSRLDVMRSLACLFYDEGRYADAATQFENIIAIYRDKGATRDDSLLLAKSKMMRDLSDASATGLVQCLEVLSVERQEAYRLSVIDALLEAGKFKQARRLLDSIPAEMRPDNLAYALYDGACLRQSGKLEEALAVVAKAEPLAEASRGLDASMAARLLAEKARIEQAQGHLDVAAASAKKSLSLYEKCYSACLVLGQIAMARGENQAALDAGHKALELNPYYAPAYLLLSEIQSKQGDHKAALESCKKAVELYPGWLDAHKALLKVFRAMALNADAKQEEAQIQKMESIR